ncbi:MAG: heme o synthase [Planctomycetota bacterium]
MSTGAAATSVPPAERATAVSTLAAYAELTKPRIVVLELVAVLAAMHIATGYGAPGSLWSLPMLAAVAAGVALVAGSANAINQWIERERDAIMPRTMGRPLPSGRVSPDGALWFSAVTLALGVSILSTSGGPTATAVALATWFGYVAVYTPLKVRTWWNTAIGAVSGATPLWIGWTAGGGSLADPVGLALVATMYAWQFPHFMAIAWLCRHDYAKADYRMSTTLDPTGWWAGVQAIVGAAAMLTVSLAPLLVSARLQASPAAWLSYAVMASAGAALMLWRSGEFFAQRSDATARRLMRASLVYVPWWLLAAWACGV